MSALTCPFCGYLADTESLILSHVESAHPEDDAPSLAQITSDAIVETPHREAVTARSFLACHMNCPSNCAEFVSTIEPETHLEGYTSSNDRDGDFSPSLDTSQAKRIKISKRSELSMTKHQSAYGESASPGLLQTNEKRKSVTHAWRSILHMPSLSNTITPTNHMLDHSESTSPRRLGKKELGPYAFESQMPGWLSKLLSEKDGTIKSINRVDESGKLRKVEFSPNHTIGVVPVIAQLVEQDQKVSYAYICHPRIAHVSKLFREGGFCGYRNIQSLASYIIVAESQGYPYFDHRIPSIFDIQCWIEKGWDLGINKQGRIETGGVKGSRKYIGTPEYKAQSMFLALDISCDAQGFRQKGARKADELLRESVEKYFEAGRKDHDAKVRKTMLPPLYLQHPGHSLTIIGFEMLKDGTSNLLVFDPMYADSSFITKQIDQTFVEKDPGDRLKPYRRGDKYLKRYNEFEILRLTPPLMGKSGSV